MSQPPIPKLPGYTVCYPQSLADKSFKKGQTLSYINGYQREGAQRVVHDPKATAAIMEQLGATVGTGGSPTKFGTGMEDASETLPQWVENDRKVLRFYGYFKETVDESNMENFRIRKVILYYYLEDDSMHVAEPRQDNSGIPQGVFVKRHKFTKEDGSFFSPNDFAVGSTATVYGRMYYLLDCDLYTREFYSAMGQEFGAPEGYPNDPVDAYRQTFGLSKHDATTFGAKAGTKMEDFKTFTEAKLGKPSHLLEADRLKQFLANNKRVLRFWCLWDDRQSMYGDRRPYVLHYFLEDDTVEILEVNEQNSGRDPFPVFLKRGQLPKTIPKNLATVTKKPSKSVCYKPEDFRLGMLVTVLNREFFLHDCDEFTKIWYTENLGYNDDDLIAQDITERTSALPRPAVAPHNGYGTIEDSLQNCLSLVPQPPKRDMHKLMNKDKIILRFTVRIIDTPTHQHSGIDLARRFILSYFMMDDSIQLFEPPVRNSGISGGKFLERQKVFKPKSEEEYTYTDLFVGSSVEVHNRTLELLEADEYTYTYMENNKHIFIMADTGLLLKSLRAQVAGKEQTVRTAFIEMDTNGSGFLSLDELETALRRSGFKFQRHQAVALKRSLDKDRSGTISIDEFFSSLGM